MQDQYVLQSSVSVSLPSAVIKAAQASTCAHLLVCHDELHSAGHELRAWIVGKVTKCPQRIGHVLNL